MRLALALTAGLAWAAPALADPVSAGPERVSVTIYRDGPSDTRAASRPDPSEGLALVSETRTLDLPAGRSTISFRGVADGIVPQTAALEGLPARLIERNTDYDLISPGAMLDKSIGQSVGLVRTDRATGKVSEQRAIVRAGSTGVLLEIDGRTEALNCSNLPERLVFDRLPPGLAERPTLSMIVDAPAAGRHVVRLSYLVTGLKWSADYVARLAPDGTRLSLLGWITLTNAGGTTFGDAPTEVVAGDLSRDPDTRPVAAAVPYVDRRCWLPEAEAAAAPPPPPAPRMMARGADMEEVVVTGSMIAKQTDLGDYKLYTLPGPTTVAARQTKQVVFLQEPSVAAQKLYAYNLVTWNAELDEDELETRPDVVVRIRNEARAGLGKPLPAGTVAVMSQDLGGRPILAGEHRLDDDVPVGLPLDMVIGKAAGLSVEPKILESRDLSRDRVRLSMQVEIVNAKPQPVTIEYRHHVQIDGTAKVVSGDRPQGRKGADPLWTVRTPAGGRTVLHYTLEYVD